MSLDPILNTVCSRIWNPAKCETDTKRFRFNAQTHTCDQFMFSGCLGNRNNFASESTCNQACSTGKLFFKEIAIAFQGPVFHWFPFKRHTYHLSRTLLSQTWGISLSAMLNHQI